MNFNINDHITGSERRMYFKIRQSLNKVGRFFLLFCSNCWQEEDVINPDLHITQGKWTHHRFRPRPWDIDSSTAEALLYSTNTTSGICRITENHNLEDRLPVV